MGFPSGFTGGVTLTLGIAYLTVLTHERNRRAQAENLRLQSRVLTTLIEPASLPPPQTREELAREERSSIIETAKDRWNGELENAIRWVQRTDWAEVREGMEGAVARLLAGGLQKSRDGVVEAEKQAGPITQEAIGMSKDAARKARGGAVAGINRGAEIAIQGAERAGAEAQVGASKIATAAKAKADEVAAATKAKADQVVATTKEKGAQAGVKATELGSVAKSKADQARADIKKSANDATETVRHPGGTIDAARGALRDAVGKGIEMGREAVGKAQAAVGLAADKMESRVQSATLSHSSAVEKALHERYQKPDGLKQSPEEVLEERYKPVDKRDNTVLRGV